MTDKNKTFSKIKSLNEEEVNEVQFFNSLLASQSCTQDDANQDDAIQVDEE